MAQFIPAAGPSNPEFASLQDGLAIVADGNTHAAITSGQYVYVKNHSTLADGWYKATANVAVNGTLSSSNLTADGSGVLNALSEQIANLIKTYLVTMPNTDSVAGGATKAVSLAISSFIDSGYSVMCVVPQYSGDDQFCFVSVGYDSSNINATIRNVSSTTDSGTPKVYVIAKRN